MLSNKEYQLLALLIFAFVLYYFFYRKQETFGGFGSDVGISPFFPFRKVQSKYFWDHGCYGRDYQCYDRSTCAYGNCNKSCFGVCRNKFMGKDGRKKHYYTNCYDQQIEKMTDFTGPTIETMSVDCDRDCRVQSDCEMNKENCKNCPICQPQLPPPPPPIQNLDEIITKIRTSNGVDCNNCDCNNSECLGKCNEICAFRKNHSNQISTFADLGPNVDKQTRQQKKISYNENDSYVNCMNDDCCSDMPDQCCHKYRGRKYCGLCDRFPKDVKPKMTEGFENCDGKKCDDIVCTAFGGRCINNKCFISDRIDL
jgi:hypothetical protein